MTEAPKILLAHHLKTLKLPTFLREYEKLARQCAAEGQDHVQFLTRLVELELPGGVRRRFTDCAPMARPRTTHGRAPHKGCPRHWA